MCHVWINSNFISTKDGVVLFLKKDIDGAIKDKKNVKFDEEFKIELHLEVMKKGKKEKMDFSEVPKLGEFGEFKTDDGVIEEEDEDDE
jgi:hypothetical protein